MKTKEEIAKKTDLDLIISDDIYYIGKFLKKSTVPIDDITEAPYELSSDKEYRGHSISTHLSNFLAEGQDKSIYVNDDGHWVGLYYKADAQKLYFIDPLGHKYEQYSKIAEQLTALKQVYPLIEIENLYKQKIQFAEVDVNNCGRFVGMTLVLLDNGVKPEEFQRLDSQIDINTTRMTNASLALAAEIDQTLFSESNKNGLSNLRTELAPIRLKKALNEYMAVVNDEVRKNIIEQTTDIIDTLKVVNDEVRKNTIEQTTDRIYQLADTDETQAQKLIMGLKNFIESPDRHNAEQLNKILNETNAKLHHSNVQNQDVDSKGFSQDATNKPIQASVKSADSEVKPSLKEKLYTCIESLSLFINTIGTSISNKFKSPPEKSPLSKSR